MRRAELAFPPGPFAGLQRGRAFRAPAIARHFLKYGAEIYGSYALGHLRLLRHAHRLEPRDPDGARACLRRRSRTSAARALPRARAEDRGRAVPHLPRSAEAYL